MPKDQLNEAGEQEGRLAERHKVPADVSLRERKEIWMYFVKYRDRANEWRWTYHGSNGEPIAASSEGYVREEACDRSIELVKQSANAPVRRR
ncbi:MAG TPA: DUF1508 domain-containing protein [Thermoanaerobaculia bacterium]|nr:DUF1508 domain-containing protein [Thermoanaerobaculia bacterium]